MPLWNYSEFNFLPLCLESIYSCPVPIYGFASKIDHVESLFDNACMDLFNKICTSGHCLHEILPGVVRQCYDMCKRAHASVLSGSRSSDFNELTDWWLTDYLIYGVGDLTPKWGAVLTWHSVGAACEELYVMWCIECQKPFTVHVQR